MKIMLKYILANAKLAFMNESISLIQKNAPYVARLLKAISHPERLIILCQLTDGEKSVSVLLEHSSLSQSAFSQHLAILRKELLVKTRKSAQTIFYSIADKKIVQVLKTLQNTYCK